jgi:hypothetical protein
MAGESDPVPAALTGLWRREEIFAPEGFRDTTTRVFWLQTSRYYADIRVPLDRPIQPGARGFDDYPDENLIALARVQGFAGVLTAADGVCLWRRDLDYQPPGEIPDEARFEIEGDRMVEMGIHAEYTEIWRRVPGGEGVLAAFVRDESPGGMLVIAGDHFLEIRGRDEPPPDGETLAAVVERDLAEGRPDLARARLAMRIAYGQVAGGQKPWEVGLSTLPWLEGSSLFAGEAIGFNAASGILDRGSAGIWRLADASIPSADVGDLLRR